MLRIQDVILLGFFMCACVGSAPRTKMADLSDPRCAGTASTNACLVLEISVAPSVREAVSHPLTGTVHWALYRGGDVSLLGPGNNKSIYGGAIKNVDLSAATADQTVVIPNASPGSYQALGYFDVVGDDDSNVAVSGDPVTFPSNAVGVEADAMTEIAVVFDFIR